MGDTKDEMSSNKGYGSQRYEKNALQAALANFFNVFNFLISI